MCYQQREDAMCLHLSQSTGWGPKEKLSHQNQSTCHLCIPSNFKHKTWVVRGNVEMTFGPYVECSWKDKEGKRHLNQYFSHGL